MQACAGHNIQTTGEEAWGRGPLVSSLDEQPRNECMYQHMIVKQSPRLSRAHPRIPQGLSNIHIACPPWRPKRPLANGKPLERTPPATSAPPAPTPFRLAHRVGTPVPPDGHPYHPPGPGPSSDGRACVGRERGVGSGGSQFPHPKETAADRLRVNTWLIYGPSDWLPFSPLPCGSQRHPTHVGPVETPRIIEG